MEFSPQAATISLPQAILISTFGKPTALNSKLQPKSIRIPLRWSTSWSNTCEMNPTRTREQLELRSTLLLSQFLQRCCHPSPTSTSQSSTSMLHSMWKQIGLLEPRTSPIPSPRQSNHLWHWSNSSVRLITCMPPRQNRSSMPHGCTLIDASGRRVR